MTDEDRLQSNEAAQRSFHRVVGAILVDLDRILFVHRDPSREWAPDTWDVPGGHIEPGETEGEAAQREIREELGVVIDGSSLLPFAHLNGPTWEVTYFRIDSWSGEVANAAPGEHTELRWLTLEEAAALQLADPDVLPVLRAALGRTRTEMP